MAKHYHTCGAEIWIDDTHWNGLSYVPVFLNAEGDETDYCQCGEWLSMEVLSEHPPERDDGDPAPQLLEALEALLAMVVEGECSYDDQGQEWPEVVQARAAIEAAREG